MKFSDRRRTLLAGLAMALSLHQAVLPAAETKTVTTPTTRSRSIQTIAQVPPAPIPDLSPIPSPTPDLTPTPQPSAPAAAPQPSSGSALPSLTPIPTAPQPGKPSDPRTPMGMFYGEQERLDQLNNPDRRPPPTAAANAIPMPATPAEREMDRFGFSPPPGTLGQTYKRRSRLIEDKKHPRIGAVEVHLPEEVDVTAEGLKTKWTGKYWRLESDPLLPGVPHIYEIKAYWGEGTEPQYRTVRLIMGRIVDLEF